VPEQKSRSHGRRQWNRHGRRQWNRQGRRQWNRNGGRQRIQHGRRHGKQHKIESNVKQDEWTRVIDRYIDTIVRTVSSMANPTYGLSSSFASCLRSSSSLISAWNSAAALSWLYRLRISVPFIRSASLSTGNCLFGLFVLASDQALINNA
jgi:hypothetical protein